jgi:hypothetical protein
MRLIYHSPQRKATLSVSAVRASMVADGKKEQNEHL